MSAPAPPTSFSHWLRRRCQVRLKSLLLVTTLCCVWLGYVSQRARQQQTVVAAIQPRGGTIVYDHQLRGEVGAWGSRLRAAARQAHAPALDWVASATHVRFTGQPPAGSLRQLRGLPMLRVLELHDSAGAADVEHLSGLKTLRQLTLTGPRVDDATLRHLRDLPALKAVAFVDTRVTDAGLSYLESLPQLESVVIFGSAVTSDGVDRLRDKVSRVSWK